MYINGVLNLVSPMQVIVPGEAKLSTRTGQPTRGKDESGAFPLTRTSMLPVVVNGKVDRYPVIPANTLRGGLRRAAADLIIDGLVARGATLTLAAWQGLRAGAVHGHPDGADPSISEFEHAMSHPYMGLFGGSPKMIPSKFRLDTAWPVVQELVDAGIVPPGCDRNVLFLAKAEGADKEKGEQKEKPARRVLVGYQWVRRTDDGLSMVAYEGLQRVVSDPAELVDAWQTLFSRSSEEEKAAAKKSEEGKLNGLRALTAMEFIMPGVPMSFHASTESASLAQDGVFLLALRKMVQKQRLGATTRHGFGRFAPELQAAVDGQAVNLFDGQVSGTSSNYDFSVGARALLESRLKAGEEAIRSMDAAQIEALFEYGETAKASLRKRCKTPDSQAAFKKVFG